MDTIDGEPMELEWHIFPGFTTLQLCNSMSARTNYLHVDAMTMLTPTSFPNLQKDSHQDDGHFSDLDQKRSGVLHILTDHKENGTESLN